MGGRPPTTFLHAQNMIYMCFSILKGPKIHVSPNTRPNELKIGRNSKQRTGNPNPASKLTPEYKLVDKSVTNVVLEVKTAPNGLKLGPYSNFGPLSTNLASEMSPEYKLTDKSVTNVVLGVKSGPNGLKLGPYSNFGPLSTNLASETYYLT